ncbi:MAG: hypothetical protein Q8903_11355, partial [Bacteroidota bacterium]|nr:hypothetical protein [Bacteroidota bacterium]
PDLQLASVHFQPFQYYHHLLLHGGISRKEFDKIIKLKNIDTKYYTDEYVDEEFIFGYKQLKDSSYVVYPDLNNDNDLSDEKPILNYDFYKTPYDFTNITSYPRYDIHFKYFDGEQTADSIMPVVFCLGENKIIIDTIVAGINVVQINKTHREGILSIDDKTVKVIAETGITMPIPRNCSIDIIDSVWSDHHFDTYNPGDTIAALDKYLLFDSQTPKGDKLIFYKLDDNIKPMGINPGYYAPNMQGVSLNNTGVSFDDISNSYNLVVVKDLKHITNKDIDYLNGLYDKYKNDKLNFICFSTYDDIGKISQLVKKTQLKWQVIGDLKKHPNNVISHRELFSYLLQIDRRFYLINKEGKILEGMDNNNKVQKVLHKYFGK